MRKLLRMQTTTDMVPPQTLQGVDVVLYETDRHGRHIPALYADSFGDRPWPADWDQFDEFDPRGMFVAVDAVTRAPVGFAISFRRRDFGYISVVAVLPAYQRRGIASALVRTAAAYLRSLGLETVRIDAYEDSPPAVRTYESLSFQVYDVLYEEEGDSS